MFAVLVLVLFASPDAGAQPTDAQPTEERAPAEAQDAQFLALSVDSVTPTTVTTSSPSTVTVTGTVRNVGDRVVDEVAVRLQRAAPVSAPEQLRTALTFDQDVFDTVGDFVTLTDELDVGRSAPFTLSMPLRSPSGPSLDITAPGIFPMLVNVNGAPDYGQQARLDDARFLLPVLGVPRDPLAVDPAAPTAAPLPPDTANPVAVSVAWPLADRPRLAAGNPGSLDDKVRLVDDDLASSLASGGRLEGLVSALEFATGTAVDPGGSLANSVCLAVDPDLLVTVSNMTRGYLVVDNPADPTGPSHDGTGADAAAAWLDRVRALASKLCVTAVPFAGTDLSAVAEIADPLLTASAVSTPSDVVDTILGVTSRQGLTWPDSGVVDDTTAATLAEQGQSTALVAANAVAGDQPQDLVNVAVPESPTGSIQAALFDPSSATALAALGDQPQTPSFTPRDQVYDLAEDSRTARLQDAIGALTWKSLTPTPGRERTLTVVPPQGWTADADEAGAVLGTVSGMLRSGLGTPRPWSVFLGRQVTAAPTTLSYPQAAAADGAPASVRDGAAGQVGRIDSLMTALVDDPQNALTPQRFTNPMREDLLRAMSTSDRRGALRTDAETAAAIRVGNVRGEVDATLASVSIIAPGGVFTLASEQSPLLLVARNDLPIGITVRLAVDAPPAMEVDDIGPTLLPPRGSRSLQVPARVSDSEKMVVQLGLTTADGTVLGEPATVNVRSNAYGRALAIITAGAGVLLLLLAGRRLWHRFRGQPDPADEG
ncbi:hypothetical protein GCM10007304_01720 [Rhodococcoides trifolii]|uniref:Glycoprotein n=1 Tax=Rhodococcoides trifolii TaxID=908250 RepID=A0A917FL04_9NOCA|nr:hypothetical protein GCM10007304_01720 [Rhodococcus trifolii]